MKEMFDVEQNKLIEGNWYVVEGFTSYYTTDYYGEVDCSHYIDNFRIATIYDMMYFGEKF